MGNSCSNSSRPKLINSWQISDMSNYRPRIPLQFTVAFCRGNTNSCRHISMVLKFTSMVSLIRMVQQVLKKSVLSELY